MASNYASEWDKPKYEPPKGFVELLTDLRSMYEEKDGIWYHDNIQGIRRIFDYLETEKGLREFLEYIGWDTQTTVPTEESLRDLGMEFLIADMSNVQVTAV